MTVRLRTVTESDLPVIRTLYEPFVEETAITFAYDPPSVTDLESKLEKKTHHPWLVCEVDGDLAGYAYAGPVRKRDAYQWAVETSVYVDPEFQRRGVARGLYTALLDILEQQGYATAFAVVTTPNPASIAFHESFGFECVGRFDEVGYKHDEWHDVEWWRLTLGPRPDNPDEPLSVATAQTREWWDDALARGTAAVGDAAQN
ncbi:N-acetyltransferase family protein [Haloferax mediterranei ATCC 33500]|uniref:Acetyltransferase n=1 Tax=Haloferax mediterranei (strain ATCC 33500 / DSM 1411 / JCM 8866 / NBRC 14739 / NCIMB 2177 / R-4) TaxID=523841 RepID=I3R8N2_HALMT|nr:GNAT family N-acetyltransferase [Haloferax mediterranei]AFK20592.1 GCN5-related N-acetyltransferase [Haloferax mediterranei ATCC 33500]AHZ23946.1 acetyltransferase [Haloferax mediterranei ATCC 33500]ELZ98374.1 N-acetyltransferase GCN5 [Haloferax mediterranei ATCC 33500]MDX5986653.1 GNAT family N-acetyltransferase [Haloferax mediterranei ATCC 33500]QCQ75985.1 N-acetyltransferase family protein [Haloferax mediterranei ATCC 33500]